MTGWQGDTDFIDPFCGSGTFLVEAALMARNIYPGVFRKSFGFEKWKDFDAELLQEIYDDDSQEREFTHHIYGYDINVPTVEIALKNVRSAGVSNIVSVEQQDFRQFKNPSEKAIMVTNPPYGERLTPPDILGLYQTIGKVLKNEFQGGEAWIISSKQELFENLGLRPSFKVQIFNGKIDCDFRKYQLFNGKLSDFRAEGGKVKTDEERRLMSDQRRFRTKRDDFKKRYDDEDLHRFDDEDLDPEYLILRRKHREFEEVHGQRKSNRGKAGFGKREGGYKKGNFKKDFKKGGDSSRKGNFKSGGEYKKKGFFRADGSFNDAE